MNRVKYIQEICTLKVVTGIARGKKRNNDTKTQRNRQPRRDTERERGKMTTYTHILKMIFGVISFKIADFIGEMKNAGHRETHARIETQSSHQWHHL